MKHWRMRGVTIHAISAPGCNYFDGRLMHACVTHLHRTRVCAQQKWQALGVVDIDVKGILH